MNPINYVKIDRNALVFGNADRVSDADINAMLEEVLAFDENAPELPPTMEESENVAYSEDEYRTDLSNLTGNIDGLLQLMSDYSITIDCLNHDISAIASGANASLYIDLPEQREAV